MEKKSIEPWLTVFTNEPSLQNLGVLTSNLGVLTAMKG